MSEKDNITVPFNSDSPVTEDDIRLLEQDLGRGPSDGEPKPPKEESTGGTDPKPGDGEEDDDHEEDERSVKNDDELDNARDDAEREAIRARRRQERQDKRARSREKMETLQRKLNDERSQRIAMENRIRQIEQRNLNSDVAQFDQALMQTDQVEAQLRATLAESVAKQDGITASDATLKLQQLEQWRSKLRDGRASAEEAAKRQPQPQQHLNPQATNLAMKFRQENPWFGGVNARDIDSQIVATIDRQLWNEGFDPANPEYWDELKARGAKYLPERFKKGGASPQNDPYNAGNGKGSGSQRRSPVAGSGGSQGSSQLGGGGRVVSELSAARVQAIKDAGMWNDPKARAEMIKSYNDYDKRNAS